MPCGRTFVEILWCGMITNGKDVPPARLYVLYVLYVLHPMRRKISLDTKSLCRP